MNKPSFFRRAAIVTTLIMTLTQMTFGDALSTSDYDEASAVPFAAHDRSGGGHARAQAQASRSTGQLFANADVYSDSPGGGVFLNESIGANQARGTSLVRKFFEMPGPAAEVTATVDVTSLVTSTVWDRGAELNTSAPGVQYNPYLGSSAHSYVVVSLNAYFRGDPQDNTGLAIGVRHGESRSAFLVSADLLHLGLHALSVKVNGSGTLIVTVQLEASAQATGENSAAFASCRAQVISIDVEDASPSQGSDGEGDLPVPIP